ncbi:MAG: hypothetical protein KC656_20530 [Myxococcales bacterium]|nr:hypothetical protein [Myxococcales bacterium]
MLLTLLSALAAELTLVSVMGDANADLQVSWALTPESWAAVQGLQATNGPVRLRVEGDPAGKRVSKTITVTSQVGKVSLGGSDWPRGTVVAVHAPGGAFDTLGLADQHGPVVQIVALGGREPAPSNPPPRVTHSTQQLPPPSPAPAPAPSGPTVTTSSHASVGVGPVDPAAVLDAGLRLAQQAADRAASQPVASDAVAAPGGPTPGQIALDPSDPRTVACTAVASLSNRADCIGVTVVRPRGLAEIEACGRLASAGLREECWKGVREAKVAMDASTQACVDVFGPEVQAMRCFHAVEEAETPAAADIRACAAALEPTDARMECIKRFRAWTTSPADVVPACVAHFPADPLLCMHRAAGPDARPALIEACGSAFAGDLERGGECLAMHRKTSGDPAGAVAACASLFPDTSRRLACVERARRDPNPTRIAACASEGKDGRILKCVEGP